jgi:hypothetical protein
MNTGPAPHHPATSAELGEARSAVEAAASRMARQMPEVDLRDLLRGSRESPLWEEVADRYLTCGNCTMFCPTCFCTPTCTAAASGPRGPAGTGSGSRTS